MFEPLNASQRRRMLRWSVAACAIAILLVPLAALPGPEFSDVQNASAGVQVPDVPEKLAYPALDVRHDPFARPTQGPSIDDDDPDFVLPPNAGIASEPVVRAVVVGPDPKALVEIDGQARIVGIGTHLGAESIAGITTQGVTLDDGERLPLDASRP